MPRKRKAASRKRKAAPNAAPRTTEEPQLKGEGRLTKQVLSQKLRRGKGPVVRMGFGQGQSSGRRDPDEIKRGLR